MTFDIMLPSPCESQGHRNLISALHEFLRGSDPDAGLHRFARMVAGGEDARHVARRLVRFASEDVGMANPGALPQALAAWDAFERLGSPEGELAIAQAIVYLGTAPRSNALHVACKATLAAAKTTGSLAPTRLMRDLGYGKGHAYDHDAEDAFSGQNYFPDGMDRPAFYRSADRGFEREVARRLDRWAKLKQDRA